MIPNFPINGTEIEAYSLSLDEFQLLTKTGSYYYNFSTNQYSCSKGYLHIHEIDRGYNSIEDFFASLHASDQSGKNGLKKVFTNREINNPFETLYKIITLRTKKTKLIKNTIIPCFHQNNLIGIKGVIQDITTEELDKNIPLNNETLFKYLVENTHFGISFSKDEKVIYANTALISMFGYATFDEYVTKKLKDLSTPETKVLIEQRLKLIKQRKKFSDSYVGNFYTSQGTIKTLEIQTKSIAITGELYHVDIITDLTDKVKLERKLLETQQIFNHSQKFTNLGSWRLTIATGELYWSDSIFKIFGFNKKTDKITYENFLTVVHPDDRDKVEEALKKSIDNFVPYDIEHRIQLKSGKIKWVQEKGNVLRDKEGQSIEMYGIVREITDAKLVAEELENNRRKYQLLAESGQELICLHSIDGQFLYASPSMEILLGYDPKKIPNTLKLFDLVHPEDKYSFAELLNEAISKKDEVVSGRFRLKHKNNKYIWCEKNVKVVLDSQGEVSIRSLTRNIESQIAFENKLKETNSQLEKALNDLKEASEAKENFLSIMSHEIRTPLNSVIGLSNLLIRRNPREDQVEVVKTLKNSADNLMHLVNDILDFNKIRSGKLELELIPFSLTEFLQQQYASFKLTAQEKDLNLYFKIDPSIPDQLKGDVTRLNQIFTNLLTNAIKFTHEGYVKLAVSLNSITEGACSLIFIIEDTGVGISPDKLESIFQPFHQSDPNISRKYGGTGLGLSIVKSLVNLMKGNLELKSTLGKGSVFSIILDFDIQYTPTREIVFPASASVPRPNQVVKKIPQNVLYVEDVESNRFLIENLLADNNINCIAVSSGKAALRFTLQKKFDVILMDIQMPGMDGYKVTEMMQNQIKGKNRNTPVIAFTAEPYSTLLKNKTIQHGIQYVITKPFNPDVLIEKIRLHAKADNKKNYLFDFTFYEEAFNYDKVKLKKIKKAVIHDFVRFKKNVMKHDRERNLSEIRSEVHRIRPIAKNLSCNKLIFILEKYRLYETYCSDVKIVTEEGIKVVKKLLVKLTELSY